MLSVTRVFRYENTRRVEKLNIHTLPEPTVKYIIKINGAILKNGFKTVFYPGVLTIPPTSSIEAATCKTEQCVRVKRIAVRLKIAREKINRNRIISRISKRAWRKCSETDERLIKHP